MFTMIYLRKHIECQGTILFLEFLRGMPRQNPVNVSFVERTL